MDASTIDPIGPLRRQSGGRSVEAWSKRTRTAIAADVPITPKHRRRWQRSLHLMDNTRPFVLDLVEQHWCEPSPEMDPSQGGRLRVVINGITVMDGESHDTGVARSALALSRTLLHDHTREDPVAEQLVLHDCGFATTLTACGVGANWWVRHDGDAVRIDGVTRFDTTYGSVEGDKGFSSPDPVEMARYALSHPHRGVSFPEASCVLPIEIYAGEVTRLARPVLDFAAAAAADKQFLDDFDRSEWLGWQTEIRENLAAFVSRLG